jgi:hypothetical protein
MDKTNSSKIILLRHHSLFELIHFARERWTKAKSINCELFWYCVYHKANSQLVLNSHIQSTNITVK